MDIRNTLEAIKQDLESRELSLDNDENDDQSIRAQILNDERPKRYQMHGVHVVCRFTAKKKRRSRAPGSVVLAHAEVTGRRVPFDIGVFGYYFCSFVL